MKSAQKCCNESRCSRSQEVRSHYRVKWKSCKHNSSNMRVRWRRCGKTKSRSKKRCQHSKNHATGAMMIINNSFKARSAKSNRSKSNWPQLRTSLVARSKSATSRSSQWSRTPTRSALWNRGCKRWKTSTSDSSRTRAKTSQSIRTVFKPFSRNLNRKRRLDSNRKLSMKQSWKKNKASIKKPRIELSNWKKSSNSPSKRSTDLRSTRTSNQVRLQTSKAGSKFKSKSSKLSLKTIWSKTDSRSRPLTTTHRKL